MDISYEYPEVFEPLWRNARYKGAKGGRGSGKSHFFALYCVIQILRGRNVLCVREIQSSITDSVKRLLEQKIEELGVSDLFEITEKEIRCPQSGAIATFKGMQNYNSATVKSLENFDVAWWEEAQVASSRSLEILIPTIRNAGSELLFSWNPESESDPIEELLVHNPPDDAIVVTANWNDNKWFPDELRRDMERDRRINPDKAAHIWDGEYRGQSEARVFRNFRVGEIEPPEDVVWFYGLDFGFSTDPTACVRFCIMDRILYIDAEAYEVGTPTESLPALISQVPDADRWPMRADNARPETIDYLKRHGFPRIRASAKGKGSVEDGITFLQGMDIVINPACANTLREFRTYSYKVDKRTNEVLPAIEDKNNHAIDALRYGAEGLHRRGKLIIQPAPEKRRRRDYDYESDEGGSEASWKIA